MNTNYLVAIAAAVCFLWVPPRPRKENQRSDFRLLSKRRWQRRVQEQPFADSRRKKKRPNLYEVEMTVNGHSKDISIAPMVPLSNRGAGCPGFTLAGSQSGIAGQGGKGKILKVESLTKKDKLVAYEAQVDTNGKKSEVQVGPTVNARSRRVVR